MPILLLLLPVNMSSTVSQLLITLGILFCFLHSASCTGNAVFCNTGCPLQCKCQFNNSCDPQTGVCTNNTCKNGPGVDTGTLFPNMNPSCQLENLANGATRNQPLADGNLSSCVSLYSWTLSASLTNDTVMIFQVIVLKDPGNYDFDIKPIVPKDGTRKPGDKCVKQTTGFSNSTYHVYNCAGVDAFQITGDTSNPPSGFVSVCEVIIYATYPLFKKDADCKNCLISSPNITCTQLRIVGCSDCVAGKTGKPFCNISCANDTYGINCNETCPAHCHYSAGGQRCNTISGACLYGCTLWWEGPMCTESIAFPTFASNSTFAVALNDSVILLSWKRVINVTDLTFSHYNYAVKMKNISIWVTLAVIRDNGSLLNETLKYYTYNLSASTTYFFQIVPSRLSFYHNVTELGNSSEEVNATTSAANVAHDFDILKDYWIIIVAVGGALVLVILILLPIFLYRRRNQSQTRGKKLPANKPAENKKKEPPPHINGTSGTKKGRAPVVDPYIKTNIAYEESTYEDVPENKESSLQHEPQPLPRPHIREVQNTMNILHPGYEEALGPSRDNTTSQTQFITPNLPVPPIPTRKQSQLPVSNTQQLSKPFNSLAAVSVAEFPVWLIHAKEGDKLHELFQQLPTTPQNAMTVAMLKQNKKKNGYDIRPYDHNRIILDDTETSDCSDYINASFIEGFSAHSKGYIVTIGPRTDTCEDFWRMVWHKDVRTIAMLVNLQERGKIKCHQYWPEDKPEAYERFGIMTIQTVEVKYYSDYTIRSLDIWHHQDGPHRVTVCHLRTFADREIPSSPIALIDFHKRVSVLNTDSIGPLTVHCSAGIGRAAVFVALDIVMNRANQNNIVSIHECVEKLRSERVQMVQLELQYKFLYDAVAFALSLENNKNLLGLEQFLRLTDDSEYSNTDLDTRAEQIAVMVETASNYTNPIFSEEALNKQNEKKNRSLNIIPVETKRPTVSTGTGYINAVFVDSFSRENPFILTETPLSSTRSDFWSLVFEYQCSLIIALDPMDSRKSETYWPRLQTSVNYGNFQVELQSERVVNTSLTIREIVVLAPHEPHRKPFEVTIYQLRQIDLRHKFDEYETAISRMMRAVQEKQLAATTNEPSNEKVLVHCSDGVTHSGLFCVLLRMMDQVASEDKIDLLFAVLYARQSRPQILSQKEQFLQAYRILSIFLRDNESDQLYMNQ